MSKQCPECGGTNTSKDWYVHDQGICYVCADCGYVGEPEEFKEQTIFDKITASEEALAPCFIEKQLDKWDDDDYPYYSFLTKEWYATEEEAITATVARLKEICDE